MEKQILTEETLSAFCKELRRQEKSRATQEKYLRDIRAFRLFLQGRAVSKEQVLAYKEALQDRGYAVRSINSMLASLNSLFAFLGWQDCRVRSLRLQQQIYCPEEKELTKREYLRLLEAAGGNPRLSLVMQTICSTGIRVSELRHFTMEAVRRGGGNGPVQGQDQNHPAAGEIKEAAAFLWGKAGDLRRRDLPQCQWRTHEPGQHLGADEEAVPEGRSGCVQGLSPQSAQALCPDLLRHREGHCQTGGHPGPQQHQYHPDLYYVNRSGTQAEDRTPGAFALGHKKALT